MMTYSKRKKCASCNGTKLETILNLNEVPLAGSFPKTPESNETYPLELQICMECKLVQTDSVIDPDVLFRDYRYMSSVGLTNHFNSLATYLDTRYNICGKKILEFGCNDGVLLKPLSEIGADVIGVDPSINITDIARSKGLNVITDYFNISNFGTNEWGNRFDFILANNAFAHIIDVKETVKAISHCLKERGRFIFEVHYLKSLIDEFQWDNIYHEHIYYYSVTALVNLLKQFGLTVVDVEHIPIHSGSIRVTAEKVDAELGSNILDILEAESSTICDIEYLNKFQKNVSNHISEFQQEIEKLKSQGVKIAGYGASGRANMFCNLVGLDSDVVEFIVDESPERCGRYIANTTIPIVDIERLKNSNIDVLIIFAWNYSKMIMEKTKFNSYKYMVAFPTIKYVTNISELQINTI